MGASGTDRGIENPVIIAVLTIIAVIVTYARVQERKIELYEKDDGR